MPRDALVGIDLGTTVLKAAAFDAGTGRTLARAERRLPVATGPDGRREQDPARLFRALRSAVRSVRKEIGGPRRPVAGLGLAAQGGSAVIADRRTGVPQTPMSLWNDTRALSYLPRVADRVPRDYWRRLTWRDRPGAGLARMLWLREKCPELFTSRNIYVGAGELLFFKMTGLWRQDAGNALQIGCYNVPERGLDAGPLELVGVDASFVAEMRDGHETHPLAAEGARYLGLEEGTPVAGPYMDHEAGYLAATGLSERPLQCSLGTAWVGNFVLPEGTDWASPFQLVLPSPVTAGGDGTGWLVVQPLLTGNVTWDWGLATLLHPNRKTALARVGDVFAGRLLAPEGLAALPWFNVRNPLWPEATGAGAFFGLAPHADRADMLRALAAAMTYEMARVFSELKDGSVVDSVVLGGGASRGAHFRRLLAALFRPLPASVFEEEALAGTRGALYAFSREAARASARPVEPPEGGAIEEITRGYERYVELYERLYAGAPGGGAISFSGRCAGRP